jgi:hypothetical protein
LTYKRCPAIIRSTKHILREGASLLHPRDTLIATVLAKTAQGFISDGSSTEAGFAFEKALYGALLHAAEWRYHSGPDEFDMGGMLQSRTGIHYEFDGVLLTSDTLYVVEAKRHARIARQHIGEFVLKLLDVMLGSAREIGAVSLKPVFVSGLSNIDSNAWSYAVSWGVLLVAPSYPTPWELLTMLGEGETQNDATRQLAADCEEVGRHLWRPFNDIMTLADPHTERFDVLAPAVYTAERVTDILQFWTECQRAVKLITNR